MTEIDGGFCPKLDPWLIGDMRLDEGENYKMKTYKLSNAIISTKQAYSLLKL